MFFLKKRPKKYNRAAKIGAVTSSLEIKKGGDLTPPMRLQIEIPLQLTIDIQNKKIPIQELTSALKGIEAAILEFWRKWIAF